MKPPGYGAYDKRKALRMRFSKNYFSLLKFFLIARVKLLWFAVYVYAIPGLGTINMEAFGTLLD